MFKSYLTIAFRNIVRNKLFSTVNILGLAFGMCSALLIFLWVNDEMTVDHFHSKLDRIYRVMENQRYTDGRTYTFQSTPGPMAPFIKEKYPEIEKASRYTWEISNLFTYNEKSFFEAGRYADPEFLDIFSFPLVKGDIHTVLNDKRSIVINESMATRYFGNDDPIGKVLTLDASDAFTVTGVMKDIPKNSSMTFSFILPFQVFWDNNKSWLDQWGNNNIRTYLLLREGTNVAAFGEKLKSEIASHVDNDSNTELFIQPYGEAYLHGEFEEGKQSGGRIEYVRIFFIVAIFVLLIACINFTNLSTAQATKRAKEAGLRKVIGALPSQLFRQFMGESFLTVCFAAVVAVCGCWLLIPLFNEISGKVLSLNLINGTFLGIFVAIIFFTAFVAGFYPSFFIAEFKPVEVLKGQLKSGNRASVFRKGLVVVQFFFSIILIISTAVVFRQMNFMENRDIGFDRDNLLSVWMQGDMSKNFETIRARLLSKPGIESVTASGQNPISIGSSTIGVSWEGKNPEERILFTNLDVDYEFIQTMKMEMVEGRGFDRTRISDTSNYIVNEIAAEKFGFKSGTADQDLTMWDAKGKIVGVVKNFNFGSLHSQIDPLIMRAKPQELNCMLVRIKKGETEQGIKSTEALWKEYAAAYPFSYTFLNQDWEEFYAPEAQRGKVFNTLAVLSIFISCLGLFGLSAFSAERRTRELGIRKVLGASVPGLIQLMIKEFASLVIIAAVIGCPVGWYLMDKWLSGYAYHVEVGYVTLILAALACLLVAMLTVSYHSIKVSSHNPAKSLKYE